MTADDTAEPPAAITLPAGPSARRAAETQVQAIPEKPAGADALARMAAGPTGLGTSALRVPSPDQWPPPRVCEHDGHEPPQPQLTLSSAMRTHDLAPLAYREREWGDGSYPPLYCPETVRIDEDLGEEVNRRLVAWAERVGHPRGPDEGVQRHGLRPAGHAHAPRHRRPRHAADRGADERRLVGAPTTTTPTRPTWARRRPSCHRGWPW